MSSPGYTGFARTAPLVVAFFLCLGAFLYPYQLAQFVTGMIYSTALATEHSSSADAETPAGGYALAGSYLSATPEEAEAQNQRPVNAEYLTALLLAVFFGVVLGMLGGRRAWHRQRVLLLSRRRVTPVGGSPPPKLAPPFLSVFL